MERAAETGVLNTSDPSVRTHLSNIMGKLHPRDPDSGRTAGFAGGTGAAGRGHQPLCGAQATQQTGGLRPTRVVDRVQQTLR
jgi:hypothetical protein